MSRTTLSFLLLVSACFPACRQAPVENDQPSTPAPVSREVPEPDTIAVFTGGRITADELDQAILALTPAQRQGLTGEDPEIYRNLVRELAMDKILLREAKLLGADQTPEFRSQVRAIRRNLVVGRYLKKHLPAIEPPTEDELRAEYMRRHDEYQRAERRLVVNLFRRLGPGTSKDDLRAELRGYREQVLAGQSFTYLAQQFSDSESRHNQGILGWFERGELAPDLEKVIFGLEEGVPSEPIATRDGVHLFYVDVVVEEKNFSLEEMRKTLTAQLMARRRSVEMRKLEDSLEVEPDLFLPTTEELRALERRGDPRAIVLRVGDFDLRYGAFAAMLENDRAQNPAAVKNRPERLLETVRQTERIYQQQLTAGVTLDAEDEKLLATQADRLLALQYRQQRLKLAVDSDPARLQEFFHDNRRRFTSPLRLKILRLSLPLDEDSATHMATLERLGPELDAGTKTLEEVATTLSAKVETLDWKTLQQLGEIEPKLLLFAGGLATGRHSPPFTTEGHIEMLRVLERKEPEPLAYEQVRGPVQAAYRDRHLQRLYDELRAEVLGQAEFRIRESELETLIRSGLHPGGAPQQGTHEPTGASASKKE